MNPIAAVVLARLSSERVPGKALHEVGGKTLIDHCLTRLRQSEAVSQVIVATSSEETDDRLADHCALAGIACFRGDLDDVSSRFVGAARSVGADQAFRVNGDSPLVPVELFPVAARVIEDTGADIVSNVMPRQLPPGASIELVRIAALERALPSMTVEDREHVTMHLYRNPDRFQVEQFDCGVPFRTDWPHMAVDEPADMQRFARVIAGMSRPQTDYTVEQVLEIYLRDQEQSQQ